jgi:hypothetical protein
MGHVCPSDKILVVLERGFANNLHCTLLRLALLQVLSGAGNKTPLIRKSPALLHRDIGIYSLNPEQTGCTERIQITDIATWHIRKTQAPNQDNGIQALNINQRTLLQNKIATYE